MRYFYLPEGTVQIIIICIVVYVVLFLIFREINCWYFKINERRDILQKILSEIQTLNLKLSRMSADEKSTEIKKFSIFRHSRPENQNQFPPLRKNIAFLFHRT